VFPGRGQPTDKKRAVETESGLESREPCKKLKGDCKRELTLVKRPDRGTYNRFDRNGIRVT